jgi:RimJ/RimL family protein N-acetyltransferase
MVLIIDKELTLSQINYGDKNTLIKYINENEIYTNTLKIPFPYTDTDADFWINSVEEEKQAKGKLYNWAIRKNSELIGGIGFQCKYGLDSKTDEIGYWLAKPFWNMGIMTRVVLKMCEFGFTDLKLERIEATVFDFNYASSRVLEKAGFKFEKLLLNFAEKDARKINCRLYSLIKTETL